MSVLKIKDSTGNWHEIRTIKGDRGEQGIQGIQGPKGDTGSKGDKGDTGYAPVRGVDYWTQADQTAIVDAVLEALPAAEGVEF